MAVKIYHIYIVFYVNITWHSVLAAPVNMLVLIVFETITQEKALLFLFLFLLF